MKIRALVLCDDAWHPAATVRRGFEALADAGFVFEFSPHGSEWSPAMMKDFPIVVVAKANHLGATDQTPWITADTQSAFRDFVQRGGGLLLVHAGTCYKDLPEMRGVTGGAFLHHPDQCLVTVLPKAGHPLTAGVSPFTEKDEHYIMTLDDAQADVFLHSRSEHGVQPAGWARTEGSGRVCVLTSGHNLEIWLHLEFQKLLFNSLCWTAKHQLMRWR
jgi:type 1 glutamine amidotransferase